MKQKYNKGAIAFYFVRMVFGKVKYILLKKYGKLSSNKKVVMMDF